MNEQQFISQLKLYNIEINKTQSELFYKYYQILIEYNQKVNLTAITEQEEVYLKHFYDCLTILTEYNLDLDATLCDVGAGAGFPSVPLKIMRPDLKVTIVDSLGKRIDFLKYLFKELGLTNIDAVHARAEEFVINSRESFDYVTARAVARLNVLSELCIPLVKLDGEFLAMKAATAKDEIDESKQAVLALGCKLSKVIDLELPEDGGERHIIVYKKVRNTPQKYPRQFSKIKKNPL